MPRTYLVSVTSKASSTCSASLVRVAVAVPYQAVALGVPLLASIWEDYGKVARPRACRPRPRSRIGKRT
jgi:hypothetical protein